MKGWNGIGIGWFNTTPVDTVLIRMCTIKSVYLILIEKLLETLLDCIFL